MMKKILVLTDFSKSAQHAAETALPLSQLLHADLLLLNTFIAVPAFPADGADSWAIQDFAVCQQYSQENLEKEADRLRRICKKTLSPETIPNITVTNAFGDLAENVKQIVHSHHISLIVMGRRTHGSPNILFGSDTNALINKLQCPLFIIPQKSKLTNIRHVIFATDLADSDIKALRHFNQLFGDAKFQLHISHVSEPVLVLDHREEENISHFRLALNKLQSERVTYKTLAGKNVISELNNYGQQINASLVALVHKKHSMFWRMFHTSTCKALVNQHQTPLLILPEYER